MAQITFAAGAAWSVAASIFVLLSPTTIHEATATVTTDGSYITEEVTRQVSWYSVQGLWGVTVLFIFASLFVLIAFLALKQRYLALLLVSVIATLFVFLAGLSIGPFYLPAVVAVLVGWFALGIYKLTTFGGSASA